MTKGVGGSTAETERANLSSMRGGIAPITEAERGARVAKAQALMGEAGIDALYLDASTSLFYFTGLSVHASERLTGAVLSSTGDIAFVVPAFEEAAILELLPGAGDIRGWQEHEDPTALVIDTVRSMGVANGTLAVDETTPFFTFDGLRRAGNAFDFVSGSRITAACRMIKSEAEIALMQGAKDMTLQVHKAGGRILRDGITTTEVQAFIEDAHRRVGVDGPTTFNIVLFGEATAYPHGVPYPQTLKEGDMVLIDIGATVEGYNSDITRSYVFGEPSPRQREVWDTEKAAQAAAFDAAQIGAPCGAVDDAARRVIEAAGFGPGYALPGLPHRTGHGIGLDVHEWTYLVKDNQTPLAPGMCFSNEPTICLYGEFGIRLEDHFHMTAGGPRWFTQPSHSVDDPFGYEAA